MFSIVLAIPLMRLCLIILSSYTLSYFNLFPTFILSQPYFGQVWGWSPTLGKSWDLSPPGLPKTQKTIWKTKTPLIGVFLVSLERSWNVDIENALAFSIWTFAAQVMGKRRAGSQTGSLTPNHFKSGIDPLPMPDSGVRYAVEKISTRATTSVQTSSRSEVGERSYALPKSRESRTGTLGWISGLQLGSLGNLCHLDVGAA